MGHNFHTISHNTHSSLIICLKILYNRYIFIKSNFICRSVFILKIIQFQVSKYFRTTNNTNKSIWRIDSHMIFHPQNTWNTIFRVLSKEIAHTVALRRLVNFKQRLVATIKQKSNRERSFKAFTLKSGFNGDSILIPRRIKRELFFKQDCIGGTSLRFIFMRLHEIGCKSAQFCAW